MHESANHRLFDPAFDRPLGEIITEFGERVCPGGSYGEIDEWSVYDESFRRLVRWAEQAGFFFDGVQPLKEGGREHDLTHCRESGTWLKFTKPSMAGYSVSFDSGMPVLEAALPHEYFQRMALQNEIFADKVTFVGVAGERINPRIVTRQPDIPGEGATEEEITRMMTERMGFTRLPDRFSVGYENSLAFIRGDVAVFDLRSANVVRTPEGMIVPIDVIPVRLAPEDRGIFIP